MLNLLLEVSKPMTGSGANNRDVKKINRIRTIRSIFSCDRISQPELAAKVNNSWPTVLQNVKELIAMGLVQEVGTFESTGGRKARAFAPVRNARLAVGLEITQNHVGAVLVDLSGNLLHYERKKRLYERSDTYAEMLAGIVQGLIEKRAARSKKSWASAFRCPVFWTKRGRHWFTLMPWVCGMFLPKNSAVTSHSPAGSSTTRTLPDLLKCATSNLPAALSTFL